MDSRKTSLDYDACMPTPFAVLGIRASGDAITHLDYLPRKTPTRAPRTPLAKRTWRAIEAYLTNPRAPFDLPLAPQGTPFQLRLWAALCAIPVGKVCSYGELARQLGTAPRAAGGACGRNPIPLIIPCHRVIAANGLLGGFMGGRLDTPLAIKRWLLVHEGYTLRV
jgi:methylated-DNA-[protein]-cysteine S-methyltransferase